MSKFAAIQRILDAKKRIKAIRGNSKEYRRQHTRRSEDLVAKALLEAVEMDLDMAERDLLPEGKFYFELEIPSSKINLLVCFGCRAAWVKDFRMVEANPPRWVGTTTSGVEWVLTPGKIQRGWALLSRGEDERGLIVASPWTVLAFFTGTTSSISSRRIGDVFLQLCLWGQVTKKGI